MQETAKEVAVKCGEIRGIADLTPYLGDREYDRGVFIRETSLYCEMTIIGMVEAGKRLICIKEMEGRGHWLECLEEIGIPQQRANELMRIAYVVTNRLSKLPLGGNLKRLDTIGKKKLLLLESIPADVLEKFGETDDVAGMKLDEIEAMTVEELRRNVRDLKDQVKNGKMQLRRISEDRDREKEKKEALLGKGDPDRLKAARAASEKLFELLLQINSMIGNEDFRAIFDSEEKLSLLKASDNLKWEVVRRWEEFAAAIGMPE